MISSLRIWTFLVFAIGAAVLATAAVRVSTAQDAAPESTGSRKAATESAGDESPPARDDGDHEQQEKRRKALAAAYVLGGVAFVGSMLCLLVMIWGRRVRRIVRTPTPAQQLPDEFWYLRTNQMKKRLEQKQAQNRTDADTDVT
jgi:hypothetical protein